VEEEGERPPEPEPVDQDTAGSPWWSFPAATWAAVGAVLVWFAVQLGRFVGEAPDLDGMLSFRTSMSAYEEGFSSLFKNVGSEGIHPPLIEVFSFVGFGLFGKDPRSVHLMSIVLFVVLAGAVERFLVPYLPAARQRVPAAFTITICPALALTLFNLWREGLMLIIVIVALTLALRPGGIGAKPLALGLVLALLPLTKENGIVFVAPFALYALLVDAPDVRGRLIRFAYVAGLPVASELLWRLVREITNATPWSTWVLSEHADQGSYVVALRAMFGFESSEFLRQNLANAFIVNWLWLPALLAIVTLVLIFRRPSPALVRRAAVLIVGCCVIYTWTTLTFPTFTEPRYAVPLTGLTFLLVFVGLRQWPRKGQPVVLGALLFVCLAGAWSPTDPVSRKIFGTASVGGEQIYNTNERHRGPDRMDINFALLNATQRGNARLRRIYASSATLVTGDCNAMKFGEKLYSVGLHADAFDRGIPGARPLRCVPVQELPPDAANGAEKIALVRTPEQDAAGEPPAIAGPSIVVIH
jgi:hypothetical protein